MINMHQCSSAIDLSTCCSAHARERLLAFARIVFELCYGLLVPMTMRMAWNSSNDYLFHSAQQLDEFRSIGMNGVDIGHSQLI